MRSLRGSRSPIRYRHILSAIAAVGLVALPAPARSAHEKPPELNLSWRAPDGCPSAASVEADFVRLLGGPDRAPTAKRVTVAATVRRASANNWLVVLETTLDGVAGRRTLQGDSCRAVASASALILAMTIDPDAAARASTTTGSPYAASPATSGSGSASAAAGTARPAAPTAATATASPTAAPPTATPAPTPMPTPNSPAPTPAPPPPAPEPPAAREAPPADATPEAPAAQPEVPTVAAPGPPPVPRATRFMLRTFVGATVALLPETAALGGFALGVRRGFLDVELTGYGSQERRGEAAGRPSAGGDFRLLAAGARACGRVSETKFTTRVCGGGEIERLSARASGVENPSSGSALMVAGAASVLVGIPVASSVEVTMELGATARPYHPTFVVESLGPVFKVPLFAAFTALGLAFNL